MIRLAVLVPVSYGALRGSGDGLSEVGARISANSNYKVLSFPYMFICFAGVRIKCFCSGIRSD